MFTAVTHAPRELGGDGCCASLAQRFRGEGSPEMGCEPSPGGGHTGRVAWLECIRAETEMRRSWKAHKGFAL